MRPEDKQEFVRILNGMAAVKPGGELTREAYEMWWNAMRDWTIDEFRAAASHLVKESEFMPNPFHFEQLKKLQRPSKHEAWGEAMKVCLGWRSGEITGDPGIDAAVAHVGGYRALALCDESKLPFLERRFLDVYEELCDVSQKRAALPDLTERATVRIGKAKAIAALVAFENGDDL